MKQDGGRKRSWGWVVVAGVVAAPVLVFVWGFVVGPRLLLWQYDRFVARHEPGTRVEELARDPFLRAATMIVADEERIKDLGQPSRLDELPALLAKTREGTVDVMWTHTPPFGRVSVLASYRNGTIVELRPSSLD